MTALQVYPHPSTSSKLASIADQILLPSTLTEWTDLIPVEECQALLAACSSQPNASDNEAVNLARSLMALYRKVDFEEPDIFSASVCALFSVYPASIGRQVIDPVKGLPSRLKFPPAIAEIKGALEDAMIKRRTIAYRAQWMLDERKRRDAQASRKMASQERRDEAAEIARKLAAEWKMNNAMKAQTMDATMDKTEKAA